MTREEAIDITEIVMMFCLFQEIKGIKMQIHEYLDKDVIEQRAWDKCSDDGYMFIDCFVDDVIGNAPTVETYRKSDVNSLFENIKADMEKLYHDTPYTGQKEGIAMCRALIENYEKGFKA